MKPKPNGIRQIILNAKGANMEIQITNKPLGIRMIWRGDGGDKFKQACEVLENDSTINAVIDSFEQLCMAGAAWRFYDFSSISEQEDRIRLYEALEKLRGEYGQ